MNWPVRQTLATPSASPAGGPVLSGTHVTLSIADGATIYYTTDGSTPSRTNGLVYSSPILVDTAMEIQAIAVQDGMYDSAIMVAAYTIIVEKSALDLIHEASEAGDWAEIDESTFAEAGVTGVTASNLAAVIDALTTDGSAPWTITQVQVIVDQVNSEITKQISLDLINSESELGLLNSYDSEVTVTTFVYAGITDVTAENQAYVRYYLEDSGKPYPRSVADIQEIVNEAIQAMMVEAIYEYLRPYGFGARPTVEVFERAGITGVDDSNIDAILDELMWAYDESVRDMFGTPMSTG